MVVIRNEHATFFQVHQMYTEYNTSKMTQTYTYPHVHTHTEARIH